MVNILLKVFLMHFWGCTSSLLLLPSLFDSPADCNSVPRMRGELGMKQIPQVIWEQLQFVIRLHVCEESSEWQRFPKWFGEQFLSQHVCNEIRNCFCCTSAQGCWDPMPNAFSFCCSVPVIVASRWAMCVWVGIPLLFLPTVGISFSQRLHFAFIPDNFVHCFSIHWIYFYDLSFRGFMWAVWHVNHHFQFVYDSLLKEYGRISWRELTCFNTRIVQPHSVFVKCISQWLQLFWVVIFTLKLHPFSFLFDNAVTVA